MLVGIFCIVVWHGLNQGVRHDSNGVASLGLLMILGGGITGAAGLASFFGLLISHREISVSWRVGGLIVCALALVTPWRALRLHPHFARHGERRDFEATGAESLRRAAQDLVLSAANKEYGVRWFGKEVPPEEVPDAIRRFIPNAAYVTVDEHGVVIVTDGLGGWRGGYMITPVGSDYLPKQSRQIAEGFFYVTSNGS